MDDSNDYFGDYDYISFYNYASKTEKTKHDNC